MGSKLTTTARLDVSVPVLCRRQSVDTRLNRRIGVRIHFSLRIPAAGNDCLDDEGMRVKKFYTLLIVQMQICAASKA
ncbi:MAG: hypothetical protein EKK65_13625 [Lysobacterales bacterium]|uniref:hypothetical protein n=1 Tax=Plasticicumulans sp. TaxID=2307179 RepID=UPI000FAEB9E3|nr:MAG: hypothetical protein EKK65_13625 [Xanthomonadales bacterium]HNI23121.1 hypothetical protein [Plasticicumulans sp.]HNJ07488.1 hypothetical protein [Plasticicumulans sp.]